MSTLKSLKILLVFIASICGTLAQRETPGKCAETRPLDGFDDYKNHGLWYKYSSTPRALEDGAKCIKFYYDVVIDNKEEVFRTQVDEKTLKRTNLVHNLTITGPGTAIEGNGFSKIYLANDYKNYAVKYSCKEDPNSNTKKEIIWVLTRSKVPSSGVVKKAYEAIRRNGFPTDNLKLINQRDCPERLFE